MELDSATRLVVQLARRGDTPDRTDRDRVREALRETLAQGAKPPVGAGTERARWGGPPPRAPVRRRAHVATWVGAGVLAVSVAAVASVATVAVQHWNIGEPAGTLSAGSRAPVAPARDASAPPGTTLASAGQPEDRSSERRRAVREEPSDATASAPVVAPSPRVGASRGVAPVPRREASVPLDVTLAEEAELLRRARDALAAGQLGVAERALREHRARASSGALAEDREALWTIVRCYRSGSGQGASGFARRFPGSALEERVESECGTAGS